MPVTKSVLVWGLVGGLIMVGLLLAADPAFATGSAGMPWEAPMDKIKRSLTGPIAMAISLLGVVVAGVALIFGGEMGDFTRRVIMLVFVIALILSASSFLTALFGTTSVTL